MVRGDLRPWHVAAGAATAQRGAGEGTHPCGAEDQAGCQGEVLPTGLFPPIQKVALLCLGGNVASHQQAERVAQAQGRLGVGWGGTRTLPTGCPATSGTARAHPGTEIQRPDMVPSTAEAQAGDMPAPELQAPQPWDTARRSQATEPSLVSTLHLSSPEGPG